LSALLFVAMIESFFFTRVIGHVRPVAGIDQQHILSHE
jgi:hypothetical protein